MTARTLQPFDPDVVAPWRLGDGPRGVVMVHGFAGTPPELRRLGGHLSARGWQCYAPVLAGHAATPEALARTTWADWAQSVRDAVDEVASRCDVVAIAGQSMGAALALHAAASDLRIQAVASLATPLWLNGVLQNFLPVIQYLVHWHDPGDDVDLWDPSAVNELWSYRKRSTHAINQLRDLLTHVRDELVQVRAPVLLIHGGRDRMVSPQCTDEAAQRLVSSPHVETHVMPRSGHAVSVDVDREAVNALVTEWFERYAVLPATRVSAAV